MPKTNQNVVEINAPPIDVRRQKFVKLAENRTRNAIKSIRVIAKLGNKNAYEFTDADVNKIARALTREIEGMKSRMSSQGGKESVDFNL